MRKIRNWEDLAPHEDGTSPSVNQEAEAEMEAMEPNLAQSLADDLNYVGNESFVERLNNVPSGDGSVVDLGDYDSDAEWGGVSIPDPVGDDVDQFNPNRMNESTDQSNMVDMGSLDDQGNDAGSSEAESSSKKKGGRKGFGFLGKAKGSRNSKAKGKSKGVGFKKKGEPDMVEMRSIPSEEFIILEEQGKVKNQVIQMVKYGLLTLAFFLGVYLTYFLLSYRLVPEDIKGTEDHFMQFSVISADYQLPLDEIKPGQIVLVSKTPEWCPIIFNYRLLQYESHNGNIIFCTNQSGLSERVEYGDVDYILMGQPRYD